MVKVLDPEGTIIGVFESINDVPDELPNRMYSYFYNKLDCRIIEVTDPKDYARLLPCLQNKNQGEHN